ncbi:MAG: molybdopterin-synthase adenylyltransferase MoeB [endosymbiont of Galathealinum brachiosum]|uniref:Molybdopterin-synthase adenylyltransferase n=1 Tax=endosymbiont of Galathealinum brachiosum TaxID=2200906 RepID=A0A370D9Y6_9GAMM|nr:MAG: molybdopterin-synthase adenylyltransferase MoeB [endosymbiont of Galathealinum brachiosum]
MNDEQLLRYSRQILLPGFDENKQQNLLDAHVLIMGLGGLGSPVAMYLAAAGIGKLTLVDFDHVELSNLQRQIIHTTSNLKQPKVDSAATTIKNLNPQVETNCINQQLIQSELEQLLENTDLLIDATDNFTSRFMINRACYNTRTPLVSGAAIRMEGQVSVFNFQNPESPCYRCLYDEEGEEDTSCSENGVMAPMVGIIGSIQAMEAIKILTSYGETLTGKLLIADAMFQEWRLMKFKKAPDCPVCGQK